MNILLTIGLLLLIGYSAGWLLDKVGLPRVIGYIAVGILFSPNTLSYISPVVIQATDPLMEVCLAFIAFEVGGSLKWSKIKKHEKEIVYITLLASLFPFIFISAGIYLFFLLFPSILSFNLPSVLLLALSLGSLASPTAPAGILAVVHQFKARGKVTDTILEVVALDDALGIILFSLTMVIFSFFSGDGGGMILHEIFVALYQICGAIFLGIGMTVSMNYFVHFFKIEGEGQWIVLIVAFITLCVGITKLVQVDELMACMAMGVVMVNRSDQHKTVFKIVERYTEDLIFLLFFLLSGLHLNIATLTQASYLITLFVILRIIGKFTGAGIGARIAHADRKIRRYTAGGLLPQAGVVIGLVLNVRTKAEYQAITEVLMTTIVGAVIIHELIGPVVAKYALNKAGELRLGNRRNKSGG